MRIACMARRSRIAAVRVVSPREAAPVAECDVRGDGGGDAGVPPIDEVVERMRSGRLIAALLDLAEADVVNDQELGAGPSLEAAGIGAIGEASMEIIEEVDAAGVAHGEALFAGTEREGLEEMALAGTALAGDDEVVVAADEVEAGQFDDECLVEARLEIPVEDLEGLTLDKAAGVDTATDALLELVRGPRRRGGARAERWRRGARGWPRRGVRRVGRACGSGRGSGGVVGDERRRGHRRRVRRLGIRGWVCRFAWPWGGLLRDWTSCCGEGEAVVFGEVARRGTGVTERRFEPLCGRLGDVLVECARRRARGEDALDGSVLERAVRRGVTKRAVEFVG